MGCVFLFSSSLEKKGATIIVDLLTLVTLVGEKLSASRDRRDFVIMRSC